MSDVSAADKVDDKVDLEALDELDDSDDFDDVDEIPAQEEDNIEGSSITNKEVVEDEFEQKLVIGIEEDEKWRSKEEVDENLTERDKALESLESDDGLQPESNDDSVVSDLDDLSMDEQPVLDDLDKDLADIKDDQEVGGANMSDPSSENKHSRVLGVGSEKLPQKRNTVKKSITGVSLSDSGEVVLSFSGGAFVTIPSSSENISINFSGNDINISSDMNGVNVQVGAFRFYLPQSNTAA